MSKGLKEIIENSHQRSAGYGLIPEHGKKATVLDPSEVEELLSVNRDLTELALPVISRLNDSLRGSGFIIILTDASGTILHISGDELPLKEAAEQMMVVGSRMDEESIGTNAMGTALAEKKPVQISGKEHYLHLLQRWTCSAAPIMSHNGTLLGTVNLTGSSDLAHPHTLGLAVAAAQFIEAAFTGQEVTKQLQEAHTYAYALMNNLSYGVFAIDMQDDIQWANDTACRILQTRRKIFIGKQATQVLPDWARMRDTVLNDDSYLDEEGSFDIPGIDETFLFNALPIYNDKKEILGFIITFRSFSRMAKLLGKYNTTPLRYSFDDIVAESELSKEVISYAKKVSRTDSTVLLTGESGTGKEVFAQSIHHYSLRRANPFVAVNCGAIPESLIESELFGYEEGSFTGSRKGGRTGKFEQAAGGTLFLDEIGEMPLNMQVKLLRTLQEGNIMRVGGDEAIPVNVRIIAATNKNLQKEVQNGKFRLDLFYRLNVIQIIIPALRDRSDDIIPLANSILKNKAEAMRKSVPMISKQFAKKLVTYDWPGNVRELNNLMEKYLIFDGDVDFRVKKKKSVKVETKNSSTSSFVPMTLEEVEKQTIVATLSANRGNISKTASILGISRNTLYQKLSKYKLS
jgi:transcriptional regulator of acetoin/glycerol metabolism